MAHWGIRWLIRRIDGSLENEVSLGDAITHWEIRWLVRRSDGDMRWPISQNSHSEARQDHCVTLFNFNFRIKRTISPMGKKVS